MKSIRQVMARAAVAAVSCAAVLAPGAVQAAASGVPVSAGHAAKVTVYVANSSSDTVTPISAGRPR